VALSCAGCADCHLQVAISCAQKSFKKAAHKNVDDILNYDATSFCVLYFVQDTS
jgi:hypothetical protein